MIYIFSSKNAAELKRSLGLDNKNNWIELLSILPKGYKTRSYDQLYLDISGLSPQELKKAITMLKKSAAFWGIIDPKGTAKDPASFFFEGASDYIGPDPLKKGLSKKRFNAAFSWAQEKNIISEIDTTKENKAFSAARKKSQKMPAGKFEGWKSIRSGATGSFFFLFISLAGKSNLRSMIGESAFSTVKNRLRDTLQQNLAGADALPWMETEGNSLFLIPPKSANCKAAIEAALKMILSSRLICIEKLALSIPLEFTFALHYGQTTFQTPGKTGAVISETVNYIFHLGSKKAETGRLTLSGDVPDEAIPEGLSGVFNPAGMFEGIPIRQSRRFVYR